MLSSAELTHLWRKHSPALLLMARSRLGSAGTGYAEDCVQEAFIRLASQQQAPDDPAAWLMRVVRNAAIDAVRAQCRRRERESRSADEQEAWLEPVDLTLLETPSSDEIQNALKTLDETTRDIVVAHLWNDLTFRQIAEVVELSAATTHRRYEEGIETLRILLMKQVCSEEGPHGGA